MGPSVALTLPPGQLGIVVQESASGTCVVTGKFDDATPLLSVGDQIVKLNGIKFEDVEVPVGGKAWAWEALLATFGGAERRVVVRRGGNAAVPSASGPAATAATAAAAASASTPGATPAKSINSRKRKCDFDVEGGSPAGSRSLALEGLTQEDGGKAADAFLNNGGLGYLSTCDLLPTVGLASRAFQEQARIIFTERLREYHPSLVLAVESSGRDISSITWKDCCRFERNVGSNIGDRWNVRATDFDDIDVLLEVTKHDGSVIMHGCEPLQASPKITTFSVPHMTLDAQKPQKGDAFEYLNERSYSRCSLQQKSLCKALYGINVPHMLKVHVVLRRRSTGQMVTVLSDSEPNQIIGEDYDERVGNYCPVYNNTLPRSDRVESDLWVEADLCFGMYCLGTVDEDQNLIQFTTKRGTGNYLRCLRDTGEDRACHVHFQFYICGDEVVGEGEGVHLVLRTLSGLRWV